MTENILGVWNIEIIEASGDWPDVEPATFCRTARRLLLAEFPGAEVEVMLVEMAHGYPFMVHDEVGMSLTHNLKMMGRIGDLLEQAAAESADPGLAPAEPAPAPPKMDRATRQRVLVNAHQLALDAAGVAWKVAFALNIPDGTEADQLEAAALDLCDAMAKLEEVAAELKKS